MIEKTVSWVRSSYECQKPDFKSWLHFFQSSVSEILAYQFPHWRSHKPLNLKRCFNKVWSSGKTSAIRSGRRPRVRPPDVNPIEKPTASSTASIAEARLRSFRASRVSRPWIVLASEQRCRPSLVLGPVLRPPCVLHTRLPLRAGAAHWSFVRLDLAWQRWQTTRPPSVVSVCSKCKVLCGTNYTCCRAEGGETKSLHSGPDDR